MTIQQALAHLKRRQRRRLSSPSLSTRIDAEQAEKVKEVIRLLRCGKSDVCKALMKAHTENLTEVVRRWQGKLKVGGPDTMKLCFRITQEQDAKVEEVRHGQGVTRLEVGRALFLESLDEMLAMAREAFESETSGR